MSFTTKDSGARMAFDSGMVRDTQAGKTLYHLLFDGPLLVRWAELLTRGAEKYAEHNWMKAKGAAELERFKASAARHFFQWMRGDQDEDHAAAVVFNLNGAEYVKLRLEELAKVPLAVDIQAETVDLDKCGTTDGVTPLPVVRGATLIPLIDGTLGIKEDVPELRYNLRVHAFVPNPSAFQRSHYRWVGDIVEYVDLLNADRADVHHITNTQLQQGIADSTYVLCDENGRGL